MLWIGKRKEERPYFSEKTAVVIRRRVKVEKILIFFQFLGKLVSLSWKYVQKNKRKRNTLEALIQKRVRVVTNILSFLTDWWAGYKQLEKLGDIFGRFVFLFSSLTFQAIFGILSIIVEIFANLRNFVNFRFYNLGYGFLFISDVSRLRIL